MIETTCGTLLPRNGIRYWAWSGNGPRFKENFRTTWMRIPLWARRRMLAYWRQGFWGQPSPQVEIIDYPPDDDKAMAMVSHFGHRLQFQDEYVDEMPSAVLQDLIAHELAHVLQAALGIRCTDRHDDGKIVWTCPDGGYFGGAFEIEEDADDMMSRWGFDPESIDRWTLETGRTKRIEVSLEEALLMSWNRIRIKGR